MNVRACSLLAVLAFLIAGCKADTPTETSDPALSDFLAKKDRATVTCDIQEADRNADGLVCSRVTEKKCPPDVEPETYEYRDNLLSGEVEPVGRCPGKWVLTALPVEWRVTYQDPSTFAFVGVWGNAASDVFVTGTQGAILHYDGSDWTPQPSGTNLVIWDVWGSSPSNVYAVAGDDDFGQVGALLHYDGTSWTVLNMQVPYLAGVWGSSANDVFAVGRSGMILHFDGSQWSQQASGTAALLWDVGGSSPTDVFAVGTGGTILHYDGSSWTSQASGTTTFLRGVWVDSPTDAFAVGEGPTGSSTTALRYDGSSWSLANAGFSALTVLLDVWGTSSTNVYGVGNWIWNFDGTGWAAESSDYSGLWGIWGSSALDIIAVGMGGIILRATP